MIPVWVALDVSDLQQAEMWMNRLRPHRRFKVGLQLFMAVGPDRVRRWVDNGQQIFLDLKLHDIPNTVGAAMTKIRGLGVKMATVHASGGQAMVRAAVDASHGQVIVVAVTVLTSLNPAALTDLAVPPASEWAAILAAQAMEAGAGGLVTSAHEVRTLRQLWPDARLVVPGIRPSGVAPEDQARVATPRDAVFQGATDLVVGRPVLTAADPVDMLNHIELEVAHGRLAD